MIFLKLFFQKTSHSFNRFQRCCKFHPMPPIKLSVSQKLINLSKTTYLKYQKNVSGKLVRHWKLCGRFLLLKPVLLAKCEASHTRLSGANSLENLHQDAHFDWNRFGIILKKEVWYILCAVLSALIVAVLNIRIPVALGDIVNVISSIMTENQQRDLVSILKQLQEPATRLLYMYLTQSLFTFSYIAVLSVSGERVASRLRRELFSTLLHQDIAFFEAHKTGEISSRLTNDVQEFKSCYKLCISQGLRSMAQTVGCLVSLYLISPRMTGLMVSVVPLVICTGALIGASLRKLSKHAQSQIALASAVADEAIGNIRTVRSFAMEDAEQKLYDDQVELVREITSTLGVGIGVFQGLTNLALNGIVLSVLCAGGGDGGLTHGDMMAFIVGTQTLHKSLAQLSLLFGHLVRGLAAGARLFQYINLPSGIPLTGGKKLNRDTLEGEIRFNNVTFSYPARSHHAVLENFNLTLPPGKMVALCGLSGGGKSTVGVLLERFYDVSSGSITIDGHDVRSLDPSWLRGELIGYIEQEPVLFSTSVMENIRYGRPDATDEEVLSASKLAHAHSFISQWQDGYSTVLGGRGNATVSGGQKQRIAIARALLKDPAILILDEATSALDVESEKAVQEALDYAVKGRTVLVIAHRLSTIQNADVIAVVNNGVITEIGNHSSLCQKKGMYWKLIQQQECSGS